MRQRIDNSRVQSGVFNSLHYPQVFNSIIAVNTVDVVNLFAVFQRLNKCVGHKAVNKFLFSANVSVTAVTQTHINIRALAAVVRPNT